MRIPWDCQLSTYSPPKRLSSQPPEPLSACLMAQAGCQYASARISMLQTWLQSCFNLLLSITVATENLRMTRQNAAQKGYQQQQQSNCSCISHRAPVPDCCTAALLCLLKISQIFETTKLHKQTLPMFLAMPHTCLINKLHTRPKPNVDNPNNLTETHTYNNCHESLKSCVRITAAIVGVGSCHSQ